MKPAAFSYVRPATLAEAIDALQEGDETARVLAGGQSLVPMLNLRLAPVDRIVDIARVPELQAIDEAPDSIRYGALTSHAAFEDGRVPDASNGLMAFAGGRIAYRAVRNRGTIGGAIALADPAADWLPVVIGLDARIHVTRRNGRRTIAAADFVLGPYFTMLEEGELIEAIEIPRRSASERWGHCKVARKTGEYADSIAVAVIDPSRGAARVVLGAVDGAPIVLRNAAQAAIDGADVDALARAVRSEISAAERDLSAAKLTQHTTVVVRAIRDALAK